MNLNIPKINLFKRKLLVTLSLVAVSLAAFATLGGDDKKGSKNFPATHFNYSSRNFSLKTGYHYRSNNLLTINSPRIITLNSTTLFQKGNVTYVLPLKRKVLLDKIVFNSYNR